MRKDKVLLLGAACALIALPQAPSAIATASFINAAKGFVLNVIDDTAPSNSRRAIARDQRRADPQFGGSGLNSVDFN